MLSTKIAQCVFALCCALCGSLTAQNIIPQHWQHIPCITGDNSRIASITTYNGELVVGGSFQISNGNNFNEIAAWNGSTWRSFGNGISNQFNVSPFAPWVTCLMPYKGVLHVGGGFFETGAHKYWSRWDGAQWSRGGGTAIGAGSGLQTFGLYQNKLVAGGNGYFSQLVDSTTYYECNRLSVLDDTTLVCLGNFNILPTVSHSGRSIIAVTAEYQSDLYVGGVFDTVDNLRTRNIAHWNGSHWLPLAEGLYSSNPNFNGDRVMAMATYHNKLYVGGRFDRAGTIPIRSHVIAVWDGVAWDSVPNYYGYGVQAMVVYQDRLWIGCGNSFIVGGSAIWSYDGNTWRNENLRPETDIKCLGIYNDDLYAGGSGDDSLPTSLIRYVPALTATQQVADANDIRVHPNPSTGIIYIDNLTLPNAAIQVYDRLGRQLSVPTTSNSIDLSACTDGVYVVTIQNKETLLRRKVIKISRE